MENPLTLFKANGNTGNGFVRKGNLFTRIDPFTSLLKTQSFAERCQVYQHNVASLFA
ncbi:hypothetical protein D3OALGA1CA_5284 [Olavius algarvensis associated proteobacterium Delta 3]|nr:hypothetical protein D3OALGB2SA_4998 [Olavius algarvensis associated proteobacterium Delta 3]CAB5164524.1 hypothetical protein D3OALGA1CA_5284 [Olavius algarvensis associated proteobacterium Delta 3]